jgi:tricarballylate dehydrogenase
MTHDVVVAGTGNAALCAVRGGLRVDLRGQVQDIEDRPIRGLYAAGELVGGLFYHNYPGGAGLMAGSVFGKAAGESAAADIGAKAQ